MNSHAGTRVVRALIPWSSADRGRAPNTQASSGQLATWSSGMNGAISQIARYAYIDCRLRERSISRSTSASDASTSGGGSFGISVTSSATSSPASTDPGIERERAAGARGSPRCAGPRCGAVRAAATCSTASARRRSRSRSPSR